MKTTIFFANALQSFFNPLKTGAMVLPEAEGLHPVSVDMNALFKEYFLPVLQKRIQFN
jgi:hypothetical protein